VAPRQAAPTVPIRPARVPVSPEVRLAQKRRSVQDARQSTMSARVRNSTSLLGAAESLGAGTSGDQTANPNSQTRTWQHAAWGYRRSVPELNAAMLYVGNCLARVKLKVGKRNPDGSVDTNFDGAEPDTKGIDAGVLADAQEIVASLRTPIGGQSELNRSYGEKMFMTGELYFLPQDSPAGLVFEVLSTQELSKDGNEWVQYNGPGYDSETVKLPPGTEPIRVWRRDPQFSKLATSSVQSCLEILEELVVLTRLVRSAAISRMALAGILAIADEFDSPLDESGEDGAQQESTNPLVVDMILTGAKAIDDPASAAAWMPYILQGPVDLIERGLKHIAFQTDDTVHVVKRREALERLAQGLDLPMEVVLGHQQTTFANAAQISEDTFKLHIEPTVQMEVDALTIAVLWPGLAAKRKLDSSRTKQSGFPPEFLTVAIGYDASELISRPDRTKDIIEAYKVDISQTLIANSEVRLALGLDPDGGPDQEETDKRIDAIRLTKIREVIAAPPEDAAVPFEDAGKKGPKAGQSAGKSLIGVEQPSSSSGAAQKGAEEAGVAPGTGDGAGAAGEGTSPAAEAIRQAATQASGALAQRIAGAAEMTVERCIERVGASLRARVNGSPDMNKDLIKGLALQSIPSVLGPITSERLLGDTNPMEPEIATFSRTVLRWAKDAAHPMPATVAEAASKLVQAVARERLYGGVLDITPELCAPLLVGV